MDKTDNQNNIEEDQIFKTTENNIQEDQIFLTYDNKFLIEKEG